MVYCFLVIAIARPQIGTKPEKLKKQGIDIFIALDVSLSMKAEDLKPNRLEVAKNAIWNFIDKLKNDRVGLILFSGTSFVQCPLTLDYNAARLFLEIIDSDMLPHAGTSIGGAIEKAIEAFSKTDSKYKVLIIFSDGEEHENRWMDSAKDAAKEGIRIYTIGIGKKEGTPIPIYNDDGELIDYKKGPDNQIVLSKLQENVLNNIARITNGRYYPISSLNKDFYSNISKFAIKELEKPKFTEYKEQAQYFIAVALILLIVELMISVRSR